MNSEFDSIMAEADTELFQVFGGWHTLENPQGVTQACEMSLDTDFQQLLDGQINYLGPVVSLLNPPHPDLTGWKAHFPSQIYTLRERLDADQSVARYIATRS